MSNLQHRLQRLLDGVIDRFSARNHGRTMTFESIERVITEAAEEAYEMGMEDGLNRGKELGVIVMNAEIKERCGVSFDDLMNALRKNEKAEKET